MTQADIAALAKSPIGAALLKALAGNVGSTARTTRKGRKSHKAKGRGKLTDAEKDVYRAQNDAECIKTFLAAGYADVKPRINVMTYNKWLAQGRMVKKGQKSIKVGPFPLFHIDQTEPVGAQAPAGAGEVAAQSA